MATIQSTTVEPPADEPARTVAGVTTTPPDVRRGRLGDAAAGVSFVALAGWLTARLWADPGQELRSNSTDQAFFTWMLAHGGRLVGAPTDPLHSAQMNVPDGVNLMANTSVLALTLPMAPVTLLAGPRAAFTVLLTAVLVGTALAWYLVLTRPLALPRPAAWVGAGFCAFSPAMVSHANGHPNIVAQFLVPLIIWRTLRLTADRWLRNGVLLGLLVTAQAFINLEILLLTAVGLGVFVVIVAARRADLRRRWRPFLAALGVAAVVAGTLLGYPLHELFAGAQSYRGLPPSVRDYGADLASFVAFSTESLAGDPAAVKPLRQNPSEENAFFGWPLVVLLVVLVAWLRRSAVVIGLAGAGLVFAALSLGSRIRVTGRQTGVPGPWAALDAVPVLDSVVPTRWALAITPVAGLLLALGCQRLPRAVPRPALRNGLTAVLVMALLPLAPTPLPTRDRPPVPDFVTSGAWRQYADGGRTVVPLPLPDANYAQPLTWSAVTGLDLRLPRGYFLGPAADPDRTGRFSAPPRPTDRFFDRIRRTGQVPPVDERLRAAFSADLRHWRAGVVVLAPQPHELALRQGMTALSGFEPTLTGGVWIWDVRAITG
ncbi:hypothetical protein O7627_32925 [Solwaraspora sp. WMMD1047]|uniref:hypothetical protein n=1 Tax=Solwaraspora sp. WMMD1047 TaxID=3016102 RepID=UPI0024174E89|nr:hypothetical protein [Solwaraspora sp. WMMD1047]MDG4834072.1 hypothetical protein [Solwaraspora sp. WMMD1047]